MALHRRRTWPPYFSHASEKCRPPLSTHSQCIVAPFQFASCPLARSVPFLAPQFFPLASYIVLVSASASIAVVSLCANALWYLNHPKGVKPLSQNYLTPFQSLFLLSFQSSHSRAKAVVVLPACLPACLVRTVGAWTDTFLCLRGGGESIISGNKRDRSAQ